MATNHRKPPYKAVLALHLPRQRGKCQWCGQPTEERIESGKLSFWHKECRSEFMIICFPQTARSAVYRRDKGICADCSAPPKFNDKLFVEDWQVDHDVPLWKLVGMEDIRRIEYFKMPNLVTRCTACHVVKSRAEASERAHGRKVRGENKPKAKKKWASRAIPSRPFPTRAKQ